ncbi:MAG: MotA/TolQ/ExbB proton channel family protein [Planctomycetes bacterium]|nr:MotA/TolQ/ExbB proton channel family protein [Planctomycetota bacterium]MCH9724344.1 MotA/TolQ/ExbB proton channel family protein [Planctomycetota bacterium]MCH9777363.1 MotA/TolQ/ExbB proton channel family protein [Planctomycetota bacterium]MCH9790130.1 MotA/TolQ/ExbB proton channel family protein [Planctomycetota bacterium]
MEHLESLPESEKEDHFLNFSKAILKSPLFWGIGATFGFYALIPHLPVYRSLIERYFCSHPLEYATAGLFFIGMSIIGVKGMGMLSQKRSLTKTKIDWETISEIEDTGERIDVFNDQVQSLSSWIGETYLGKRLNDIASYVKGRRSVKDLDEHLKYLAELAADQMHASYSLIRTITWAVPIIGFLGTVIGITIAIANVTPDQLDTSLSEVTGGLAVAFDTTALALGLSLVLVFSTFIVERMEQKQLEKIELFGLQNIASCLSVSENLISPLESAEVEAAQQLVLRTEEMIQRQTELWQNSLEALRARWSEMMEQQQESFDSSLQEGMSNTLGSHSSQLESVRNEFLSAYQSTTENIELMLTRWQDTQKESNSRFSTHLAQIWNEVHQDVISAQTRQTTQIEEATKEIAGEVKQWNQQLKDSSEVSSLQLEALNSQSENLLKIVGQEEHLVGLQRRLSENLDAIRATETFEETLHSLSAAVHLLTARSSRNNAA